MPAICSEWRDLPYREIWAVDCEYYPGAGLANGGTSGDRITPLCLVALEMRSGGLVRLWQGELGPFAPYRLDGEALIISFNLAAEFSFHLAQRWGQPACAVDAYVEFRHLVNDGSIKSGDRPKGFHSIDGALRYFCEDAVDSAYDKDAARDRILRGPPFSAAEQQELMDYCCDDVRKLAKLIPHIVPTIRSLPHALMRAKVQWAIAQQERRGVPLNAPLLARTRDLTEPSRIPCVEGDSMWGCHEATGAS